MIVQKIKLTTFRNYEDEEIDVHPGINVFFGANAQGKTNILEAIYLCACARSHRTARDGDLIHHGENQYRVDLGFADRQMTEETITIHYLDSIQGDPSRTRSQRHIFQNGMRLNRIGDLMGLFHAVIFAPEDLMLVKEGPSTRRRFIDLLISQLRPSYFLHLQHYSQYLVQRNQLLKQFRSSLRRQEGKLNDQQMLQLEIWDQAMSKEAAAIMLQRHHFCRRISEIAEKSQKEISSGKEELNVKYKSISGISLDNSIETISTQLFEKLKTNIYEDIERGNTLYGPHRDDLEMSLNGEGLKPYASQGQQRSAVLALKLAELQILSEETGEPPVLLLDDVMSELDEQRRDRLLSHINESQVFITCTDADQIVRMFRHDDNRKEPAISYYHVRQGKVLKLADTMPSSS